MAPREIIDEPSSFEAFKRKLQVQYQRYLDASVPHRSMRWTIFGLSLVLYFVRVIYARGYYVITYGMSIHLVHIMLHLLTPLSEPEMKDDGDSTSLPTSNAGDGEFRPFVPKVQEFVVWMAMMKVVFISFFLTLFSFLDIPVFWPILALYFFAVLIFQMEGRLRHMKKHRYVPWNSGKPKYVPKSTQ